MTRFHATFAIKMALGVWLIPVGWLISSRSALAQTPPAAPAPGGPAAPKPRNAIQSGSATLPPTDAAVERAAKDMAEAALYFWKALTPELQAKCSFPFDTTERFNWHFIPRERRGITWNDMTPAQQALAHAFLASGLSNRGYQQAETIMSLDQILKELEQGKGPLRDPNNYAFSIFGTPGEHSTWGWRFEGHHLSLTFTVVDGRAVAGPVFFGTNPATVLSGPRKGLRVLAVEEDLGRELIKSLTPEQRKTAIYDVKAPVEIITGNSRKANPGPPVGVAAGDMTAAQQKLLMTLVENSTGETFRYPSSRKGERHLEETGLINVEVFGERMAVLADLLEFWRGWAEQNLQWKADAESEMRCDYS